MKTKLNILVVTDDADATHDLAGKIAAELKGNHVVMLSGLDFAATDLLPADICFFGCEKAKPPTFSVLEEVLLHINLAGRTGGVFSPGNEKVTSYLRKMLHDSGLNIGSNSYAGTSGGDIKTWVHEVLRRS